MKTPFKRQVVKKELEETRVFSLINNNNIYIYGIHTDNPDYIDDVFNIDLESETFLHYTQNFLLDVKYFSFRGIQDKFAEIQRKINLFLKDFIYTREEVLKLAISPSYPREVNAIALSSSSEFDQELFDALIKAFEHPNPEVRFHAVASTVYTYGWDKLKQPLEQVIENDTDSDVRIAAEEALKALIKHNWNREKELIS
jgi:HEAT repeats